MVVVGMYSSPTQPEVALGFNGEVALEVEGAGAGFAASGMIGDLDRRSGRRRPLTSRRCRRRCWRGGIGRRGNRCSARLPDRAPRRRRGPSVADKA